MGDSVDWGSLLSGIGGLAGDIWGMNQTSSLENILKQSYAPAAGMRGQFANMLKQLMSDPNKMLDTMPGFTNSMDMAMQSMARAGASKGISGSGTLTQAMANAGSSMAMNEYNTLFGQLSGLAGFNLNPADYFKGMSQVSGQQQSSGGGMFGDLLSIGTSLLGFL